MAAGFAQLKVKEAMVEKLHRTGKDTPHARPGRAIPALLAGRGNRPGPDRGGEDPVLCNPSV